MRLAHLIERVYLRPMLITADGHAAIRQVIENKYNLGSIKSENTDEDTDLFGDPMPKPYDFMPGVRAIPVNGPIGYKVSGIEKVCGVCDVGLVNQWTKEAMADNTIDTILYDFNTPGGEITQVMETAELIEEAGKTKNTIAFTDTMACSAGMWLMAASNEIYTTKTADIMSVGVYSYLLDYSKMYEEAGIKVEPFVSGDLKGIGIPGRPLTDSQRQHLQAEVDMLGEMFRGYMKKRMPKMPDDMMRGQSVMGLNTAKAGLTNLVSSMDDIFAK